MNDESSPQSPDAANPYESPSHSQPEQGSAGSWHRLWYLFGSMALFFVVPACLHSLQTVEPRRRFIEISSLGGQVFLVAFWTLIAGWLCLLIGNRTTTLLAGGICLLAFIALPFTVDDLAMHESPYWGCLASCSVLVVGAFRLPQKTASP